MTRLHRFPVGIDRHTFEQLASTCLLYTSDAADERSSVDLGGRRIINTKKEDALTGSEQLLLPITHFI